MNPGCRGQRGPKHAGNHRTPAAARNAPLSRYPATRRLAEQRLGLLQIRRELSAEPLDPCIRLVEPHIEILDARIGLDSARRAACPHEAVEAAVSTSAAGQILCRARGHRQPVASPDASAICCSSSACFVSTIARRSSSSAISACSASSSRGALVRPLMHEPELSAPCRGRSPAPGLCSRSTRCARQRPRLPAAVAVRRDRRHWGSSAPSLFQRLQRLGIRIRRGVRMRGIDARY